MKDDQPQNRRWSRLLLLGFSLLAVFFVTALIGRASAASDLAVDASLKSRLQAAAAADPSGAAEVVFRAESSRQKRIQDSVDESIYLVVSAYESSVAESLSVEASVEESVAASVEAARLYESVIASIREASRQAAAGEGQSEHESRVESSIQSSIAASIEESSGVARGILPRGSVAPGFDRGVVAGGGLTAGVAGRVFAPGLGRGIVPGRRDYRGDDGPADVHCGGQRPDLPLRRFPGVRFFGLAFLAGFAGLLDVFPDRRPL